MGHFSWRGARFELAPRAALRVFSVILGPSIWTDTQAIELVKVFALNFPFQSPFKLPPYNAQPRVGLLV